LKQSSSLPKRHIIHEVTAPINRLRQALDVAATSQTLAGLLKPLQDGWFEPVFPPLDSDKVRSEWRNANLRWFNSTAMQICKDAGGVRVRITWRLTKQSKADADCFSEWLEELKTNSDITVERYMLVDKEELGRDVAYKQIVEDICTTRLPRSNQRYSVWYIDSSGLAPILNRDFALLHFGDLKCAQGCQPDTLPDRIEVLRIYFSQNYEAVQDMQNRFKILAAKPKYCTLEELCA
jgi:hypothetical protein